MGLFSGLTGMFGNVSQQEPETVEEMLSDILIEEEIVVDSFIRIRDMIVFTDLRLILVDMQGVTGKKTEYVSLPYGSISHFSVITMGQVDLEVELRIWMVGDIEPSQVIAFNSDHNVYDVQRNLAEMKFRHQ